MGRLVLYGIGGIIAVVAAFKIVLALLAPILAIGAFILFKVVPLLIIGWLVMRVWRKLRERPAA